jgi:tetratricopeptide (TPR) repeat protein
VSAPRRRAGFNGWLAAVGAALLALPVRAAPGAALVVPAEGRDTGPDSAWVAHAVAETLPRDLAFLGVAAIGGDERRRALEVLEIPNAPTTLATSIRVAEALGATRLVTGSYAVQGATLELSLRLTDVEHGTLSAPLVASGPLESVRELLHGLAWDIALSGSTRPQRTRDELRARDARVPYTAFRSYCEALRPGDAPARIRALRHALALAPGYDDAELALGGLLVQTREFAPALEALSQVDADASGARRARFLEGLALYELGRYTEAATLWGRLAGEAPGAAVLNNHALARLRAALSAAPRGAGFVPPAAFGAESNRPSQVLRAASEIEKEAGDLVFNLGFALFCEGDDEAAAFWLRGRVREDASDVHARVVLAWALRRAGRGAAADEEWRTVAALAPGYETLGTPALGRRFERLRTSETTPALDRDGRSDAELAATHAARGERLLEAGDAGAALGELTRAAYLDPYGARVHRLLARAHRARGEPDKALTELRMSLWCRQDADVRLDLAGLLRELNREPEARQELLLLLQTQPDHAAARTLLDQLKPPD